MEIDEMYEMHTAYMEKGPAGTGAFLKNVILKPNEYPRRYSPR